jgi:hypothetical protein
VSAKPISEGAVEEQSERIVKLQARAEAFFEPQLADLGLSVAAIENQDLSQLRSSLEKVNHFLANPNQLGTFRTTAKSSLSFVSIAAEATHEVGALPLLLKRKTLIVDRIAALGGQRQASTLRDLVEEVQDPDIQFRLRKEIDQLAEKSEQYLQEKREIESAKQAADLRQQSLLSEIQIAKERAEIETRQAESRAAIRQRFLERESVATIVGSFLLIILAVTLIVAMFTSTSVPEILSNGFFIILGYFFGQTAVRAATQGGTTHTGGSIRDEDRQ